MYSKLFGSGRWIPTRHGPRALDEHQSQRLRSDTLKLYSAAGRDFASWLRRHGLVIRCAEETDDLLVEWKNAPDGLSAMPGGSVQQLQYLIAFVEWVLPQYKQQLNWSHSVANAWQGAVPIKHTVPLPRFLALVAGVDIALHENPRVGAMLVLQQRKGWRPNEAVRMRPQDISLPGDGWSSAVVRLGEGRGTKLRRGV